MRFNTALIFSSSGFALAVAIATPAVAQVTSAPAPVVPTCVDGQTENCTPADPAAQQAVAAAQDAGDQNAIVVTGSRIRRPNLESNVPVTSVTAEDLTSQGDVNVGDALNDLPSLRSTFSQANSTRFIGTAGVNNLDLRGLGTSRTLVLVNGRRHVTYSPGDFLVDTNTIPTDLIERVDVVTGGSSAVYGSDAVAGVVNFVLKRDFDGIRLKAQTGVSSHGDRAINFVTGTFGKNFADDRGNVAVNLEYVRADPLYFVQRPGLTGAFNGRCQLQLAEPTAGEPQSGDGVPDNQYFCGVRNAAISNGGTLGANVTVANCTSAAFGPGGASAALGAARCINAGTPNGQPRIFRFDGSGNLLQDVPALDFRPFASGNIISAADSPVPGATLRDTGQLAPGLKRYTGNILASFEISPALRPFFEGKFVRVDALQEGQPSFFQGTFPGFFGGGRGLRCDNPFLTAQNISALQGIGRCAGGVTSTETLPLGRFNVDFGGRAEVIRRETYRLVGGITGRFNDDWNYEVSVNYGHLKSSQKERNDLKLFDINGNEDGFLLATDVVRNSAGQIVCRVNQTTVTRPDCVPINVFGVGQPSQAALDFVNTTSRVDSTAAEFDALAFVGGDLSQVFELPGGPIRFAIGGEYRTETAKQTADPLSASGGTFFNAFSTFDPPKLKVRELFGEVEVPLLKDITFIKELTVTAAGRLSKYNTQDKNTFAYNINGTYAPFRDLRFRANYSKSVRTPTLNDLYATPGQNFGFVADPCDVVNINNGSTNRVANCAALGVPVGFVNNVARSQTIGFQSGGNPNLTEETGKSLTLGGVFTPHWVPGLSFTVDYYKIRVDNLIAVLGAQTILNQCVDLPTINNQFCQVIFPRQVDNPATPEIETGLLGDPALLSSGINFARQIARGIDFEVGYRKTFTNGLRLNTRAIATRVLERTNFTSPTDPAFGDRLLGELGDPKWAANANISLGYKGFDLRYSANYVGKATIGAYENYYSFEGRPPQNADTTQEKFYRSALYHAIRASAKVLKRFEFYAGVDNIFGTKPPLGLLGTGGGEPYDSIGRYMYAGITVDF
jgi:outer membrane receptor protein involved in Fe transport